MSSFWFYDRRITESYGGDHGVSRDNALIKCDESAPLCASAIWIYKYALRHSDDTLPLHLIMPFFNFGDFKTEIEIYLHRAGEIAVENFKGDFFTFSRLNSTNKNPLEFLPWRYEKQRRCGKIDLARTKNIEIIWEKTRNPRKNRVWLWKRLC